MGTFVDNTSQPLALESVIICPRHVERQAEEQWQIEADYVITSFESMGRQLMSLSLRHHQSVKPSFHWLVLLMVGLTLQDARFSKSFVFLEGSKVCL